MMRWWNSDVYNKEKKTPHDQSVQENNTASGHSNDTSEALDTSNKDKSVPELKSKKWMFTVRADTHQGEVICVTGNCASLGNWKHDKVLILSKVDE